MLIDYDPCSNWGNWNLVAKVSADPRMDRYFNVYTQATKYDPKGEYVSRWLPELASVPPEHLHLISLADPATLAGAGVVLGETYPQALFDVSKWTRRKKVDGGKQKPKGKTSRAKEKAAADDEAKL